MADFDKNLQSIIKPTGYKGSPMPIGPGMNFSSGGGGGVSDLSQKENVFAELEAAGQDLRPKGLFISNAELEANKRYKTFNPTIGDYEDFAAQGQEWYKQAANGVLKGANLAATTVAGGFGMLYGVGKATLFTQKLSDIWDNEVMRTLDKWNEKVDNEYLPNYYTAAERNSEWYSTDNWFTTNFLFDKLIKNSGYAVGAMVGGNIANAGLMKLGTKLGGLAAKGATAAEASQAFKLFTPLLRNTARAFSTAKNVEAAALLDDSVSSIADLTAKASKLSDVAKQTTVQFARFSDAARRTAVATYSSAGEASFEALQTAKEFRENLIEEYTREKGYAPVGEDLKNINLEAEKVGKTSFFGNMALLTVTEFNQLPYLIGSNYSASRQAANSLMGKVDDFKLDATTGKYAGKAGPKTRFGKLYEGTKRAGMYVFDPKESAQEILQYGLQVGTQNYFKKAEEAGEADLFVDGFLYGLFGRDEFGKGVGALVSKEGIEGGILGGITGGLMQARGNYMEKKALAKNTENFLNMINNAPTFKEAFQKRLEAANRGVVLQQQHRDAIINGDKLEATDLKYDLMHTYLEPRIKYGRFDMVMEDLAELKQAGLTEKGLAELKEQGMANINDDVNSFQKRIASIENSAKDLNNLYQALNIRYAGETVEIDGEERLKYSPRIIDMLAYAGSKIANYDVRLPQLNAKLSGAGINTQAILQDIIETGVPNAEATREALNTINSMDVTSEIKDELKGTLDDVIELSLRRRMFINEYDSIKNNPLNYERPEEEIADVDVRQKEGRKKVTKTLEVGKTYSLAEPITLEKGKIVLAPKFTVLSSTLGGEFEVQLPDGTTTFFSPEQFDKYNISDEDNTSQELEDILNQSIDEVLNYPAFRDVVEKPAEGVNKLGYINSLGNKKLTTAVLNRFNRLAKDLLEEKAKTKAAADKIKESKTELDKQQEELSDGKDPNLVEVPQLSDSVGEERISSGETGPLKSVLDFFDSTTTESEDPRFNTKLAESPAHVRRSRIFLNNARKMKNRNNLRAIVFTYNQEASLGLSGITALSYKTTQEEVDADVDAFRTKVTNVDNGFVAAVFVEIVGNKKYFIDENGNRIAEVNGQPVDLGRVIFQTMPTTSIEYSNNADRYREDEEQEFKKLSNVWRAKRNALLSGTATPMYEFNVSKGFPVKQKEADGTFKKNPVTQSIIDEKTLLTTPGVINVATTENVTHNGKIIKAKKGHVYIQDGEIIQYLNNNRLGKQKATTAYQLIKSVVNKLQKDAREGKVPEFPQNNILFLKNVLNYIKPKGDLKDNQLWFDTDNLVVKIGKRSYEFSQIDNLENEIVEQLSNVYHSANSKTLKLPLSTKFFEYVYEDGKLQENEWPNYQTYLASGKDVTGKNTRVTDQVPFVTIANPTSVQPYPFAGKYATLINFDVEGAEKFIITEQEKQDPPKQSERQSPAGPSDVIVNDVPLIAGPYELNSGKENVITYNAGPFRFKANLLPNGEVEIDSISNEINKDTYVALSKNKTVIDRTRELFPDRTKNANDEQVAKVFLIYDSGKKVSQALAEEQAKQAPPTAPQAPVSDVEDQNKSEKEKALDEYLDITDHKPDSLDLIISRSGIDKYTVVEAAKNAAEASEGSYSFGSIIHTMKVTGGDLNYPNISLPEKKRINLYNQELAKLTGTKPDAEAKRKEVKAASDLNSLIDERTIKKILTDGTYSFYPNEEAVEKNQSILITEKNVDQALKAGRSWGEFIIDTKTKSITGLPEPYIYVEISKGSSIEFINAKDLENFINDPSENTKDREIARKKYNELAALEGTKPAETKTPTSYSLSSSNSFTINKSLPYFREVSIIKTSDSYESVSNLFKKLRSIKDGYKVILINDKPFVIQRLLTSFDSITLVPLRESTGSGFTGRGAPQTFEIRLRLAGEEYPLEGEYQIDTFLVSQNISEKWPQSTKIEITDISENDYYKKSETKTPPKEEPTGEVDLDFDSGVDDDVAPFRKIAEAETGDRIDDRDIEILKAWHAEKVPNLPYEVLENIIKINKTERAWGVYENGVAKFFKRGLRGTEYHEIFEGIWKAFLTESERQALIEEFKSRKGDFLDRESGKFIPFSNATDRQAKERIADDFADFRVGKLPARTLSQRIRNFFNSILEFFKSFVTKPSLKKQLFEAIEAGKFKDYTVSDAVKSASPEYRKVALPNGGYLPEDTAWALVQDMTLTMADFIFNRNTDGGLEKLYYPGKITGKEVYNNLRLKYEANIAKLGEEAFKELFFRAKDVIRTLGAEIDVEGIVSTNDGETSNRLYAPEAFEVDFKKNMKFAVKFLLAMSPATKTNYDYQEGAPEFITYTNTKGKKTNLKVLNNYNRTFAILLNELSNTSLKKVDEKFMELVRNNGNYYRIGARLRGDVKNGTIDFSKFDRNDMRFYIQFVQSFMKSNPFVEVAVLKRGENGIDSFSMAGDRTSAMYKTKNEWFQNIKKLSESSTSFVKKDVVVTKTSRKVQYVINDKQEYYPDRSGLLTPERVSNYLKNIGIDFPVAFIEKIYANKKSKKRFDEAVKNIYEFGPKGYALLSGEKFGETDSHVTTLADMYVRAVNPDQDTTRLNVKNKRTGNFSDSNAPSVFEAQFNEAMTFEELLQSRPELADAFSKNSLVLQRSADGMFFDEDGNKKEGNVLRIGVIDGLQDQLADRGVSITELTKGQRFTVEMNQNLNGRYYILVPADSSTERMIEFGTFVDYDLFNDEGGRAFNKINKIFTGYLEDEITLALDWENRSKLKATKKNAKELRFFKDILAPEMVDEIHRRIEANESVEEIMKYVDDNKSTFEQSIKDTLQNLNTLTLQDLQDGGEVFTVNLKADQVGYIYPSLDSNFANNNKLNRNSLTGNELNQVISFANMNMMIANIEMHKFLFGDPYQFKVDKGKLDETKRIKSWLSPRRITVDRPEINLRLNQLYSGTVTPDISLEPKDMFLYEFKEFAKTATIADVNPKSIYRQEFNIKDYDEADGFSIMIDGAYREVKLKNGEWAEDRAEPWFQWNQSYARQKLAKKGTYKYTSEELRKHDEALIKTPQPPFVSEVMKPIVSGVKYGMTRIEALIDKMSQMPITYKMVEGTNLENLYVEMLKNKIGYVAFTSARKEGVRDAHSLYRNDGTFNTSEFGKLTIENVAWSTYGIQVENSYEEGKLQTRISQLTKNDTMDMFQNGKEAEGYEGVSALTERKKNIFKQMHENAFKTFLNKLGIVNLGNGYVLDDPSSVARELERELMKRNMSQNIVDTIRLNEDGQFSMPFEASSAYEQIRSVLISMINKSLISPSMNGKPHVQVPSTLWEDSSKGRELVRKIGDRYEKITREQYNALSKKDKGSVRLTSTNLKFYENKDGERYMEILIPNYWKKYFPGMSDEEVFKYLNKSENQKILFGVGARIPHQAMSSTEVFKVKGFLDPSMGSTVVVPSEIVAKAGSDFDIDKLNMYLKSVYVDEFDNVKLVEYKGSEEATIEFYEKVFEETIQKELENISNGDQFRDELLEFFDVYESIEDVDKFEAFDLKSSLGEEMFTFYKTRNKTIKNIIDRAAEEGIKPSEYVVNQMGRLANKYEKLSVKKINENAKRDYAKGMYKKSLENEYYEILQSLITLPGNFERLMSPVNDAGLSEDADVIDQVTGNVEANIKNKLVSRSFMTSLRHAFVMAKKWVGIAAVNITGHSIGQQVGLYFDRNLIDRLSDYDKSFLKNLNLKVPHNTVEVNGQEMISLGSRQTADGKNEFISDRLSGYATAFVDVAKDPYILKLLQSDVVVGTAMLMERIGVGKLTPYFLRQPIITEYLKMLDRKKSRSLFGKENRKEISDMFPIKKGQDYDLSVEFVKNPDGTTNFEKSRDNLINSIKEYSDNPKSSRENNEFNRKQRAVFNEFLALAKLAQLNYKFSQAYNYDTTRVRNYEGFKRKMERSISTNQTNIISSLGKVFNGTFIGDQVKMIREELKALGAIMKLDNADIEMYIDNVMEPFYNDEFMSADDFDFVAKKLKTSFLDFVIQTKSDLIVPADYKNLFTGNTSVAARLLKMKERESYPSMLNYLVPFSSLQEKGPVTVALKVKPEDAIDINRHIGMMLELKEQEPEFYNDLVKLSILQGTFETNLSVASVIPVEDRARFIAPIINTLSPSAELDTFYSEGMFYRNNFADDRIVPEISPRYQDGINPNAELVEINYGRVDTFFMLPSIGLVPANPQLIKLNNKYSFMNESNSDFVKMKRYQFVSGTVETKVIDLIGGKQMSVGDFKKLSNEGKISPSQLIGYKKVRSNDNLPLTYQVQTKDGFDEYSVFKMVNLYGNSRIVSEYPKVMRPSVFDNNTVKVEKELSDQEVINLLSGTPIEAPTESTVTPENTTASQSEDLSPEGFETLFPIERQEEILTNFANKHSMSKEEALSYIKEALQKDREAVIAKLNECY